MVKCRQNVNFEEMNTEPSDKQEKAMNTEIKWKKRWILITVRNM